MPAATDPAPPMLALSGLAAIAALASVAAGLLLPDAYAAVRPEVLAGAYSQDTVTVAAAAGLLVAVRAIGRGHRRAWLVWAGLLGYLVYGYGLYSFDGVMNPVFPLYIAVLSLSSFALLLFLRHVRADAVRELSARRPPRRLTAALFVVLAALFGVLWGGALAPWMTARAAPPGLVIYVLDLGFALPLVVVAAWLLWRRDPVGDLLAVPLLIKVATLGLSVFLGTLYAPAVRGGGIDPGELALYALMGFGPLALIVPFLRAVGVVPAPFDHGVTGRGGLSSGA